MKYMILKLFVLSALLHVTGCTDAQTKPANTTQPPTQEELIQINRERLKQERADIEAYIQLKGYNMQQSGSGMYIMYLTEPLDTHQAIQEGDRVEYAFSISTLQGDTIARSEDLGTRILSVGKENAEIGLHEALQEGYIGIRMLVILPSHLAHGISQNEFNVPPHTTLVYELKPLRIIN